LDFQHEEFFAFVVGVKKGEFDDLLPDDLARQARSL
jgi:hypothetical protein